MSLYLDGRLNASGARQLERHLADCAACRRDLARLRLAEPALREGDPMSCAAVPDELAERVMRRVAAYETERAASLARAARRKAARRRARLAFWRGQGWRLVAVVVALVIATGVWWRTYPENGVEGAVTRFWADALQLLVTPGPDEIAWGVWIGGAALALVVGGWLVRADASAAWRRALVERLPQLW
jgi:anti-sigma factor RsiW